MDDNEREKRRLNEAVIFMTAQVMALRAIVTAQLAGVSLADGGAAAVDAMIAPGAYRGDEARALALSVIQQIMSAQERMRSDAAGKPN